MNLTDHFTLEELTHSEIAVRNGIDNTPAAEVLPHLVSIAQSLEKVRKVLGCPLLISSGYRSHAVNHMVGGSDMSAHCEGYAADFIAPKFGTPQEIARTIRGADIAFDQLIYEGTWVHLSVAPRLRGEVLTAHFGGGRTTYTEGIA